jgi:two-component system cell cycle response regulator CpdR
MPEAHILLVEDEANTRELLTHVLRAEQYTVHVAAGAAAAATRLNSTQYALVIADWVLPDGNGIDIAEHAANLGAKTILMSGYLFHLPAGAAERHELMMKPIRPHEMVAAVRQSIGGATANG